jgi:hypothetical protein
MLNRNKLHVLELSIKIQQSENTLFCMKFQSRSLFWHGKCLAGEPLTCLEVFCWMFTGYNAENNRKDDEKR